jgi:hypothetical protein
MNKTAVTLEFRDNIVDQLRMVDSQLNVPSSQKARYHQPLWQLVLNLIPGKNDECGGITANDIHAILTEEGYDVSLNRVRTTIQNIMNPEYAIDNTRRLIGKRAYNAIMSVGGVHVGERIKTTSGRGASEYLYTLGITTRRRDSNVVTYHFKYDSDSVKA